MPTDNSFTISDLESIYRKVKYYFVYGFPLDDNILIKKLKWYSEDKIPQFEKNRLQSPTEQEFAKMEKFINVINSHDFYVKADKELQGSFGKRHYIEKKTYEIGQELWQNYLYTLYDRGTDRKYGELITAEGKKLRYMKKLWDKLMRCGYLERWEFVEADILEFSEIPEQQENNTEEENREALKEKGVLQAAYKEMKTLSVLEEDFDGSLRVCKRSEADNVCNYISSQTQIVSAIAFLDKFVPLSVLGYLFQQRIVKKEGKVDPPPIIIRGLSPFIGLQYENIYRSIKAVSEKIPIRIGDKKIYEPEIWVSGESFIGRNEDIYISESKERQLKDEGRIYQIEVFFFWNSDTEYIEKRIWERWTPIKNIHKREIKLCYESPYYASTEKSKWNVRKATYLIAKSDLPEFERWCDSFGDFAVILNNKVEIKTEVMELPAIPLIELDEKSLGRKAIKDRKLLSRYNSLAADKQLKTYPTEAEWGWLVFVLEKFPNFTKIFLSDDVYAKLKGMVEDLVDGDNIFYKDRCSGESWFDGQIYDIESTDQAGKYRRILDDIRNKRCCESKSERTGIHYSIPYVLDMNYTAFTRKAVNEPFMIMVYDLKEKRSCAVQYKDFYTTDGGRKEVQENLFPLCERYYYLCAYCVRLQWKTDNKNEEGKRNYAAEFVDAFETFKKAVEKMDGLLRTEMENVITNSFQYMYQYAVKNGQNKSVNEKEREVNGVALFQDVEFFYKSRILKKMTSKLKRLKQKKFQKELMDIPEEDIKDFIVGTGQFDSRSEKDESDGKSQIEIFREKFKLALKKDETFAQNEAVFCNELKKCIAKFRLKPGCFTEKNLDILYDYFREFHCFGQYKEEAGKDEVLFSVEYPRFEFRRVHQILLALSSMIDFNTVWPEETKNVLQKRLEGKEKNRKELEKILFGAERDGEAYTGEER